MKTREQILADLTDMRPMFDRERIDLAIPDFRIAKAIPCRFDVREQTYIATTKDGTVFKGQNKRIVIEQAYVCNGWAMVKDPPAAMLLVSSYLAELLVAFGEMCLPLETQGLSLWLCYGSKDEILSVIERNANK